MGAYNAFRAFGLKYELFTLAKAETLKGRDELIARLKRQILPNIKIIITGHGKVGSGIKEILDSMKLKQVNVDDFIQKNFSEPVYCQIDVLDYNKRIDGKVLDNLDFYKNPSDYVSDFERFTKVADMYISGHFHANGAPDILTREMLNAPNCKIKIVADVSCDVNGPIACTLKASTIADPLFGYLPSQHIEVPYTHPGAIVVMSVDNLPCEIPNDASIGFGEMFMKHVVPAFFDNDKNEILSRAQVTKSGKLTPKFSYLQDYLEGK